MWRDYTNCVTWSINLRKWIDFSACVRLSHSLRLRTSTVCESSAKGIPRQWSLKSLFPARCWTPQLGLRATMEDNISPVWYQGSQESPCAGCFHLFCMSPDHLVLPVGPLGLLMPTNWNKGRVSISWQYAFKLYLSTVARCHLAELQ